jgi:thiamine biosynthesis lipoprotein
MRKFLFFSLGSIASFAVFAGLACTSCTAKIETENQFALDTVCTVSLYDKGKPAVYNAVWQRLRDVENELSVNLEESELSKVNAAAGLAPVKVSPRVFYVIERALHYAAISGGAFDPAIGPLVKLWNITGNPPHRVPSKEEIDALLPLVNYRNVTLNKAASTVFLQKKGMALDLGAIGKGYAADEAADVISKAGINSAIVNLGGNVLALGKKKDGSPWRIGIRDPFEGNGGAQTPDEGSYIGIIDIVNKSLVTSGVYERYFIGPDGKRYHHIISPFTGYPVENGLVSVSIVADKSIDADGLSTTIFALGYEKGSALVKSLGNIEAVFIFDDRSVRVVGNQAADGTALKLTDARFHLVSQEN